MLVVRGTKKLRDRVKAPLAGADDASTTELGDWFATALFWRPQVALLVNERTFLPVFLPLAPTATLLRRIPEAIGTVLRGHGADDGFLASELAEMGEQRIAPTNNRSVVGVMNEFAFLGEHHWDSGSTDFEGLSLTLARTPVSPLYSRTGFPDRELAAILGVDRSNVVPIRTAQTPSKRATAYQLKVTLRGTKPPIWRRLLVDGSSTLAEVHEVIQAAFGWWNYHLYEFAFGRTRYGIPDPDWDFGPPARDARRARLDKVAKAGDSFTYTYDFGDDWEHKVTVEKVGPVEAGVTLPTCTDGRRAGPPEDCGGPWGYEELLKILRDPSHPEHTERVQWMTEFGGGEFDADAFDPAEFSDSLTALRLTTFDD
ncbi:MAG: plasmid pRiA4b ORF-3 family protein [Ilumatobacteraceae bacterium]